MATGTGTVYTFGPFRLDPTARSLRRNDQPIPLAPKTFALLALFVESDGRLLSKHELIRELWDDAFVEEGNLTYQISTLRKALGAEGAGWIETVPKAGYRFLAPVVRLTSTPAEAAQPAARAASEPATSSLRRWLIVSLALVGIASLGLMLWQPPASFVHEPAVLTPLTTYPGSESDPIFSPDGNQLAFRWNGTTAENDDIYVITIGASEPLRLTNDSRLDTRPSWSPDGRLIAFLRHAHGTEEVDLLLVSPTGGREQTLTRIRSPVRKGRVEATIAWAPDGDSLIVPDRTEDDEPAGLVSFEVSSGVQRRLTRPPAGSLGDLHPVYSSDGSTVAFIRQASCCEYQVMLVPAAGGDAREIARRSYIGPDHLGLAWLGDTKELAWALGGQLWRVPVDGRPPTAIVEAGSGVADVAFSRHGRRLAYAHESLDVDVWSVDLTLREPEPRRLVSSTKLDGNARFSPDGEKITFVSNRSGAFEIWVADANGANPLRLTSTGSSGSPRWSPDGNWIAFDSTASGDPEIYIIGASGGTPRRITSHPAEDSIPVWSPDGRWLYFTSTRTGIHQIWRIEAHSGGEPAVHPVQVTRTGGRNASVSADGEYVYFVRSTSGEHRSLVRMPLDGGPETVVVPHFKPGLFGYALSGDLLFYVDAERDVEATAWKVRRLDPGRGVFPLADVPLPWEPHSIAASPDCRILLLTATESRGSDIMLLEGFQ